MNAEKKENSKHEPSSDALLNAIREGYDLPASYFTIEVKKAVSKDNIATVLDLGQLTDNRFENFYVETDKVRETNTISSLQQLLNKPLIPYSKLLFSGFTGSGKTTELINLSFRMQYHYNIIIFSAWNRLKFDAPTIESLLFEIVEDVLNLMKNQVPVDENDNELKDIISSITTWCSETTIISEAQKEKSTSVGAGLEFLKGVFFKAKTESRSQEAEKTHSIRIEERKINDLIFECNRIFDYLSHKTGKDTLIIIDDLEKMPFGKARDFYINYSSFIRDFRCKMILTLPVELIYHSDFAIIQNVFGEAEVLPMIKIKNKKGNVHKPGVTCLAQILARRIELALFEDECYKEAVKYSGGSLRELFRIVQRAAIIEESDVITKSSMKRSISYHKDTFASRIQERNDELKITFQEYLDILFEIYDGNKTTPERNMALLDLLRTRAVMKYNGDGFYDTHPLLDSFIKAYKEKKKNENR